MKTCECTRCKGDWRKTLSGIIAVPVAAIAAYNLWIDIHPIAGIVFMLSALVIISFLWQGEQ